MFSKSSCAICSDDYRADAIRLFEQGFEQGFRFVPPNDSKMTRK